MWRGRRSSPQPWPRRPGPVGTRHRRPLRRGCHPHRASRLVRTAGRESHRRSARDCLRSSERPAPTPHRRRASRHQAVRRQRPRRPLGRRGGASPGPARSCGRSRRRSASRRPGTPCHRLQHLPRSRRRRTAQVRSGYRSRPAGPWNRARTGWCLGSPCALHGTRAHLGRCGHRPRYVWCLTPNATGSGQEAGDTL